MPWVLNIARQLDMHSMRRVHGWNSKIWQRHTSCLETSTDLLARESIWAYLKEMEVYVYESDNLKRMLQKNNLNKLNLSSCKQDRSSRDFFILCFWNRIILWYICGLKYFIFPINILASLQYSDLFSEFRWQNLITLKIKADNFFFQGSYDQLFVKQRNIVE